VGLRLALAGGSVAQVYEWSQRCRAQSLLLPQVRPPEGAGVREALEELRRAQHALRAAELHGAAVPAARAVVERLQRTLRERAWAAGSSRTDRADDTVGAGGADGIGGRSATPAAPAPMAAVAAALGGRALVVQLLDGPVLRALVLVDGRAVLRPLGDAGQAVEILQRLRADLDVAAGRVLPQRIAKVVAASARGHAETLGQLLMAGVEDLVGDRELVVVPTGAFVGVPWPALPACQGRPVTVAPSTASWLSAGRSGRPAPASGQVLLVAGPGIERGEAEVAAVAGCYRGAAVLSGARATTTRTVERLPGCGVVHVAAHGHHEPDNALFSRLELADGPLFGYELQGLPGAPRIAVLSACELGRSDVRPGDETLGMVASLLGAGSATVVASVCRVPDDVAHDVMVAFHGGLAAGTDPAVALASAQQRLPSGGFVCFGAG
jgi:hypothetical protein